MASTFAPDYGVAETVEVFQDNLDSLRTVHHSLYAALLERATIKFWEAQGFWEDEESATPDYFMLVRELLITFDRPIHSRGPLLVHFWADKVGTTSLKTGFRFLSADGTEQYAHGHRVTIKVDPVTYKPTPWSENALAVHETMLVPSPAV